MPGRPSPGPVVSLRAGECFSVGALLEQRPVSATYVAAADTFCYQLSRGRFRSAARAEPALQRVLHALSREPVAGVAAAARHALFERRRRAAGAGADRCARSIRRPPVVCAPDAPLESALRTMQQENVGSILVQDPDGKTGRAFSRGTTCSTASRSNVAIFPGRSPRVMTRAAADPGRRRYGLRRGALDRASRHSSRARARRRQDDRRRHRARPFRAAAREPARDSPHHPAPAHTTRRSPRPRARSVSSRTSCSRTASSPSSSRTSSRR